MKNYLFNLLKISAIIISALFFTTCDKDKENEIKSETLTVEEVTLSSGSAGLSFKSVKVKDEKGSEIPFSDNANNWFENATLQTITIPQGTIVNFPDLTLVTKARFVFNVDGEEFSIGFGPGSKLVVQKSKTGKYNLLPKETVQLSPPP